MVTFISAQELRSDLAWTCILVQSGQTLILKSHGEEVVWIVKPPFARVTDTIESCDDFTQLPEYNSVLAAVLRKYARLMEEKRLTMHEVIAWIWNDVKTILSGLSKAREIGLKL